MHVVCVPQTPSLHLELATCAYAVKYYKTIREEVKDFNQDAFPLCCQSRTYVYKAGNHTSTHW